MERGLWLLSLVAMGLVMASCNEDSGPMEVLEEYEERLAKSVFKDNWEVAKIEKTNGQKGEVFGVRVYKIEYVVTLRAKEDLVLRVGRESCEALQQMTGDYAMDQDKMSNALPVDTIIQSKTCHKEGLILGHLKGKPIEEYDFYIHKGPDTPVRHFEVCKLIPKGYEITSERREQLILKDNG